MTTEEEIMSELIPECIRHLKFCRVRRGEKKAFENDIYTNPLSYEQILPWIEAGNNYGVICGPITGIAAIDADHIEYVMAVENNLPATFSVRSSSDSKRHFYIKINNFPIGKNKISLLDPDNPEDSNKQGGDIRFGNFYLVGPGSIHPDTKEPYRVVDDEPIAEVEYGTIEALLLPYYKTSVINAPGNVVRKNYPLSVARVLGHYGVNLSKANAQGEMSGSHPVHGSTGGTNFGVNIEKNVWCCRRCNTGGSVMHLVAMMEGLIVCDQLSNQWPDDIYDKTLAIIKEKFDIDLSFEARGPLNDTFNANWFANMHKDNLRYCGPLGGWLSYNGMIWVKDDRNTIKTLANQTYTEMQDNPPSWVPIITDKDDDEAKKSKKKIIAIWKGHVKTTGSAKSLDNMTKVAQKDLSISDSIFDADPMRICLKNGEYDLKNYKFSPFNAESYFTRQANYSYDPDAKCPHWEQFLKVVFLGDSELIEYIQRCVGYSLTDDVSENAFFILHGDGANGKSTFVNTIRTAMGSYATTTPVQTLMAKRNESINNDVARLRGLRLI